MMILDEKDGGDSELLVYAMTLVNKVLYISFSVVMNSALHICNEGSFRKNSNRLQCVAMMTVY